jgi:hypothetical protein
MIHTTTSKNLRRATAILAIALVSLAARSATAATISYSLMMCEDLGVLKDPMNKTLMMNAAWKPQHTLMLGRTMPYLELRNTSEEGELTQLSLSIGDTAKNFDWAQLIESSPGVTFSLVTPDAVAGSAKSDTLVINFIGLGPDEFVRFRTGLSPDIAGGSMISDYRMTFFEIDGGADTSGNSLVKVQFNTSGGPQVLEKQMPNFAFGMPTSTSLAFKGQYMDMIMPFTLTDEGEDNPDEPAIPEPGTLVLLGIGMLGLTARRLGLCRRTQAR